MSWIVHNLYLIPALPLFAAAVLAVTARPHKKFAAALTDKSAGIYGITLRGKPGWGENSAVVSMLNHATKTYGCGRLDYEYSPNVTDDFGSTLVPMAFPLFTNGCIDVAEGHAGRGQERTEPVSELAPAVERERA